MTRPFDHRWIPGPTQPWAASLCVLLMCFAAMSSAIAANARQRLDRPELSVLVSPPRAWVQQQVVQRIRLESAWAFNALKVDIGKVQDVQTIELDPPSTHPFESWGVEGHVYELARAFFPTRSGPLEFPAVHISGEIILADGSLERFDEQFPAQTIDVQPAESIRGDEPWLVTTNLKLDEQWSTMPTRVHAGQITRRTFTITADGVSGEHIPPLTMVTSSGISVLPGPVERHTRVTPNQLIGSMVQSFDIRIDTEGTTDIAPVQIAWWEPRNSQWRRSTARGWRIEPLPPDVDGVVNDLLRQAQADRHQSMRIMGWVGLGLVFLSGCLLWLLRGQGPRRRRLRQALQPWGIRLLGPMVPLPEMDSRWQRSPRDNHSTP